MRFFDQIKSGGFLDPATLQGAALFAVVFAFFAWFFGRAFRMAVQRLLAHDKHAHLDLMAVKFLAKLTRYRRGPKVFRPAKVVVNNLTSPKHARHAR